MKRAFVIIYIVLTNIISVDLYSQANDTIYFTSYTGGSYANYWCKIASMEFVSGYQDFANTIEFLGNGSSNSTIYWGKLILRSKRQNSDPNGPPTNFQMQLYNSNLGSENIQAVGNDNLVEVYLRIPSSWTTIKFISLIGSGSTFQFYKNQLLLQNLPSGTIYSCKEGEIVSEKVTAKNIETTEVKVTSSGWSDFVFEPDYNLPTLSEVENYIDQNGHLPDIPSAKEVEKNGINLGEMDAKLLQKIEELTLYVIELKKENEEMKAKNKEMDELKAMVKAFLDEK